MSELLHLLTEISGIQPELLVFPSCVQHARVRLSAWRRNENSLVGLQWYTNTNTLCRDLFVFWFHFDQQCNRKWESGSSAAQPPAKKAPWRCYKCWEWSSVVWEGCSMHVCRPAVYIHLLLSCWISSHELRPEVHPGHCSIYTHHCTGPVLLIIRSTDAQMSPRAKWVHMCFMFLFLMCGNTQLNESVCQVQAWKCSASVIIQFVSL